MELARALFAGIRAAPGGGRQPRADGNKQDRESTENHRRSLANCITFFHAQKRRSVPWAQL
jgi:hypothetical protein